MGKELKSGAIVKENRPRSELNGKVYYHKIGGMMVVFDTVTHKKIDDMSGFLYRELRNSYTNREEAALYCGAVTGEEEIKGYLESQNYEYVCDLGEMLNTIWKAVTLDKMEKK